jgi:hypothetical protein
VKPGVAGFVALVAIGVACNDPTGKFSGSVR